MSSSPQPKQQRERTEAPRVAQLEGRVKSVVSGDTIVLAHPTKPVDKTLTLASVNAPRLARRNEEKEEDFAFEAREFLRTRLIGKKVSFQVEYTNPKTGRDYGSVFLEGKNIGAELLANGLATLKDKDDKNQTAEYKELVEARDKAREAKLGVHSDKKNYKRRTPVWADKNFDVDAKLKSFKGKPVDVVVEHVLNGSSLRVLLPTSEVVLLQLTGVQAPGFKWEDVGGDKKKGKGPKVASPQPDEEGEEKPKTRNERVEVAQPFAKEARHYTEMRLLHRDATVLFESSDSKFGTLYGTIIINSDEKSKDPVTFQEELLLKGLAKLTEWGAAKSKYLPRLRAAENVAKQQKLRIWKDYKAPEVTLTQQDTKEFGARVVEIISGDTLRIKDDNGNEEKISLSSIRAPRMGSRKDAPEPWAIEAREAIRRQIAGKKVSVRVDYRRTLERPVFKFDKEKKQRVQTEEKETEERRMCSVIVGGRSIAVELVKEGYASVIRHKPGEERSIFYDQLMLAETEAEKKGKGKHGKRAPSNQINDISSETVGAVEKVFRIIKEKQTKAIVEKVLSGTRYKLFLPKESIVLIFALSGLTSPSMKPKEDSDKPKPFAKESVDFANDNLLFREVDIIISDKMDNKNGSIYGDLIVKGDNFAIKLLENGYAMLQRSANTLKNYTELKEAEKKAKGPFDDNQPEDAPYPKGINVWSVPPSTYRSAAKKKIDERQKEKPVTDRFTLLGGENNSHHARVTSVVDVNQFFIQTADAEQDLAHLEELMTQLNLDGQQAPSEPLSIGALCFAKYVDGAWYRGKVVEELSPKDNKLAVRYIDFGNTERVALNDLRVLNKDTEAGKIAPKAVECKLAFIEPHKEKFRQEATQYLKDLVEDRDLFIVYEYSEGGIRYVTIEESEEKTSESVNQTLLRDGLVFIDSSLKSVRVGREAINKKLDALQNFQDAAKRERLCLWEDGDVYGDEDDFE